MRSDEPGASHLPSKLIMSATAGLLGRYCPSEFHSMIHRSSDIAKINHSAASNPGRPCSRHLN